MTKEKSQVKMHTATEIGADLEDMLESAETSVHMHDGAKLILGEAVKNVGLLATHLEREVAEGRVKIEDLVTIDAVVALVRKYIGHAQTALENMKLGEQNAQMASSGMVVAYKKAMGSAIRIRDAERQKLEEMELAELANAQEPATVPEEDGRRPPPARVEGMHPGNPLAARRAEKEPATEPETPISKKSSAAKGKTPAKPVELHPKGVKPLKPPASRRGFRS